MRPLSWFALFAAVGSIQGWTVRAAMPVASWAPVFLHLTGAVGAWVALPSVLWAARSRRALHGVLGYVSFAVVHLLAMLGLRQLLRLGWPALLPARSLQFDVLYELQHDLIVYAGLFALLAWRNGTQARHAAELRAAKLHGELAAARLQALRARVSPHFLYNALNTVGALMYDDLPRTERLLRVLGELLRGALDETNAEWTLEEELAHAALYLELIEARFPGRVRLARRVDDTCLRARLPRLLVQHLIENAVKHNGETGEALCIEVEASRRAATLQLQVRDDGLGFRHVLPTRLVDALKLAYGTRASVKLHDRAGACVELQLPFEVS